MSSSVLIIDDDRFTSRVYSEILLGAGYQVSAFTDAREALKHFRLHPGGVVLLDLFLKDDYGVDILPQFLMIDPATPVVLVTAHASLDSAVEAIHRGAYDYVVKPIDPNKLLNIVRRASEHYRLAVENRKLLFELTSQIKQLEHISRISMIITSTLELEPLLNVVMEQTQELLKAQASSLMILNEEGNLNIAIALGPAGWKLKNQVILPGQGIAGWVLLEKKPVLIPDVSQDAHFDSSFDQESGFTTKSILAAPLVFQDRLLGVIEIINRIDGSPFQESDLKLLLSFTPHIAVAIENARITDELRKSREELEKRVEERTSELSRAYHDLEESHRKLTQIQSQLIQSEKLAALGQLAAGVAHEINNPIAYIQSNLNSLTEYFTSILEIYRRQKSFLKAWENAGEEELFRMVEEIRRLELECNIEGLIEDLGSLLAETKQGAQRVTEIVKNLRSFARADTGKLEIVDVNQRLRETLNVINNELKWKAEVVKDFGDIPQVEGYPGELNQVFLNILVNAVQAIPQKGIISIRTFENEGMVKVEISDNGVGIPPENLPRIFDPFFTTKPPGQGTGLGLSVAYGIVKKHKGTIEVKSVVGTGTTFTISFPAVKENGGLSERGKSTQSQTSIIEAGLR